MGSVSSGSGKVVAAAPQLQLACIGATPPAIVACPAGRAEQASHQFAIEHFEPAKRTKVRRVMWAHLRLLSGSRV